MGKKSIFIKYLFDKIAAFLGIIVLSPVILIIFIIHKIVMPGGSFIFKQERVGQFGVIFNIYKIRTMKNNVENNDNFVTTANDDRILPFGKWLRRTKLDEIVELVNVLKGDMSLVGTRPPLISEFEAYQQHHRARMSVKPGITGMWQVSGRSNITDFEQVVELDKKYIREWSMGLDFRILLQTIKVVLGKDGSM